MRSAHVFSFPVFIQVIDVTLWSLIPLNSEPVSWQFFTPSSLQESVTVNPLSCASTRRAMKFPCIWQFAALCLDILLQYSDSQSCWASGMPSLLVPGVKDFRWQYHTIRGLTKRSDAVFLTLYYVQTIFYQCASQLENFSYLDFKR